MEVKTLDFYDTAAIFSIADSAYLIDVEIGFASTIRKHVSLALIPLARF